MQECNIVNIQEIEFKNYEVKKMEKNPKIYKKNIGKSNEKFSMVEDFTVKRDAQKLAQKIRNSGNNARVLTTTWQGKPLYEVWMGKKKKKYKRKK